ncbi:MAG TPA: tyrosine-type recombinase/integrase [Dysgonamonadaceae bacterium]|nr:tyrosine-type recombinase/integrase [Dysgonamonadaceae bacterium]
MKNYFELRNYVNKEGKSLVYLKVVSGKEKERINFDILVSPKEWDIKKRRLKSSDGHSKDINLILDNIEAKVTNIKTVYRLSEKVLTPKVLRKELLEGMPRVNFNAFAKACMEEDKDFIKSGTYRRYESVLEKLMIYQKEIFFNEIDNDFFNDFRRFFAKRGNQATTLNSNVSVIKKWLRRAQKKGIKLRIDLDDIVSGNTSGNRVALTPDELKKICGYYFSDWINPIHKLSLGYFLFSCFTGLRLSDVMNLTRRELNDEIQFISIKTSKDQIISLNKKAKQIIESYEPLFVEFIHPNTMNIELKNIMKHLGIKKKISFHCARHSFATNFLRMGGKPEKLQKLLGHSKITTTMVYVHILSAEANEEIFLLDNLF